MESQKPPSDSSAPEDEQDPRPATDDVGGEGQAAEVAAQPTEPEPEPVNSADAEVESTVSTEDLELADAKVRFMLLPEERDLRPATDDVGGEGLPRDGVEVAAPAIEPEPVSSAGAEVESTVSTVNPEVPVAKVLYLGVPGDRGVGELGVGLLAEDEYADPGPAPLRLVAAGHPDTAGPPHGPLASFWKTFDGTVLLEVCVPILDGRFRMLRDAAGVERVYEINNLREVTLLQNDKPLRRALNTGLLKKFGGPPPSKLLTESIDLWKLEGEVLPGEPEPFSFQGQFDYCVKRLDWEPSKGPFPSWEQFLRRLSDPPAFMAFVWSIFEMANRSRQYLWLSGDGQDGKSVVLEVLAWVFGPAAAGISATHLARGNQFQASLTHGKRLITYPDCKKADLGTTEWVRNITSGDLVQVERKFKIAFSASLYAKLIVGSNLKPLITSQTADQSRLIHIEVGKSKVTDDPRWREQLRKELPFFLFACREAYVQLCQNHGDITLSSTSHELKVAAGISAEENFHDIFEENFRTVQGVELPAREVSRVLREKGLKNNQSVAEFKAWVRRLHGVTYRATKLGRVYVGLGLVGLAVPAGVAG